MKGLKIELGSDRLLGIPIDVYIPSEQVTIEVNLGSEKIEMLKEHLCKQRDVMASVLESASMHAMIVFTPGHAQTAVETWSGSGQYFLIETTMLPFTATQDALQSLIQPLSAEEWANYLYNKEQEAQQSGGMVYVVDCDLAPVLNIQGLNY